ncbi:MAG: TadE/TadG family type IV pilus assembly protein [Pseudolabrys sp.]
MFDVLRARAIRKAGDLLSRSPLRRFIRHQDGTSAIEFALVAVPFIALMFAIIETALVFFAGQTLEAAAATASRLILTGQAQSQGLSANAFKTKVCAQLTVMFDCTGGVYVDVKTYTNFASTNMSSPVSNGNFDSSALTYTPGGPSDIVVMKLYYQWPIYVSLLNTGFANLNGNKRLLVATSAFRNEPYK